MLHYKQENYFIVYHFIDYAVYSRLAGWDGGVGVATCYGLSGPGIESWWRVRFFSPAQAAPGVHPSPYSMGTGSVSLG